MLVSRSIVGNISFSKRLIINIGVLLYLFAYIPFACAIGISPPIIPIDGMLRNSEQTHSVTLLVQDAVEEDKYFTVTPRGEYAHYIRGAEELIIPKGKKSAVYTFDVAPRDAAVGSYELLLTFTEKQKPKEGAKGNGSFGAEVRVTQGATAVISLGITGEERVAYEILSAQFDDTEVKLPLVGSLTIHNTGNVEWKPDRVDVELVDVNDETNTASLTIKGENIPSIKPLDTQAVKANLDHTLIEAKYKGIAKVFYGGAQVAELEIPPFNVFAVGTLAQSGEIVEVKTNKTTYNVGEKIAISALFRNTGEVTTQAQLETKIFKGDELIDIILSSKLYIDRGQESMLQQYPYLNDVGEYRLEISADYGNRKTKTQTLTINVESKGAAAVLADSGVFSVVFILVAVLSIFGFVFYYIRKKRKQAAATAVVTNIEQGTEKQLSNNQSPVPVPPIDTVNKATVVVPEVSPTQESAPTVEPGVKVDSEVAGAEVVNSVEQIENKQVEEVEVAEVKSEKADDVAKGGVS